MFVQPFIEFEFENSDLTAKSILKLLIVYTKVTWKQRGNTKVKLEKEYGRPYQGNEPESSQNIIIKFVRCNKKSMFPDKTITSIWDKHSKNLDPLQLNSNFN